MNPSSNVQANTYQVATYSPALVSTALVPSSVASYSSASSPFPPFPPMMANQSFICITYHTAYPPVYHAAYPSVPPVFFYPPVSAYQIYQPCPPAPPAPPAPPETPQQLPRQSNPVSVSYGDSNPENAQKVSDDIELEQQQGKTTAKACFSKETCEVPAISLANSESEVQRVVMCSQSTISVSRETSESAAEEDSSVQGVRIVELTDSDDDYPILLDEVDEDAVREAAKVVGPESVADLAVKRLNTVNRLTKAGKKKFNNYAEQDARNRKMKSWKDENIDIEKNWKLSSYIMDRKIPNILPKCRTFAERFRQIRCRTVRGNVSV